MIPAAVESSVQRLDPAGRVHQGRERFDAWATARPAAAPIRLAAGRINRIVGNYAAALTHLNAALNSADVGVAANFEKAHVLEETGKREEADAIYNQIIQNFLNTAEYASARI